MRLARGLDGGKSGEAANTVVGMHHEIADAQARHFGEDVPAAFCPGFADEPVAEDVLLADHGKPGRLEAGLKRQHGEDRRRCRSR